MKNLKIVFCFSAFSIFFLYSFIPQEPEIVSIHGTWVNDVYEDGLSVYKKTKSFKSDEPGFQINPDGTLLKRQNIGWCGTPPVSYGNYEGKWKQINDNYLQIEYDYWGGRDTLMFEIVSLDIKKLKLKRVSDFNQ